MVWQITSSDDYFGFPGPLVHLPTSEYSVEGKAAVLIDWREGVETQVPASGPWRKSGCRNDCIGSYINGLRYGPWY